ncbi:MAG: nucleoside monophosphate kinase [Candidatus Kerfeldbacteria bacterium]|nr:nucleoside monophosphate kinase [Candidatus Kerfeldbacteria bacterium]
MTTPRIVILGPQGAGKGTQAGFLSRRFRIPHISAGDLLRAEARRGSPLGQRIARIIDRGRLVPDELMSSVVRARLRRRDAKRGWIVDGYPRFRQQAKTFNRFARPNVVVVLTLSDQQAVRRLVGRRVCPNGHVYHIRHHPPKQKRGYCDHDGLPLHQRDDDTPVAIRRRLRWHHQQTDPLIDEYRRQNLVLEVNAHPPIKAVYRHLLEVLKNIPWLSSRLKKK